MSTEDHVCPWGLGGWGGEEGVLCEGVLRTTVPKQQVNNYTPCTGSTDVRRENNGTAIIIGVGVTIFLFILAFFFFGSVMYTTLKKRRRTPATGIATDSFALTGDLGRSGVGNGAVVAAVNVSAL